MATTAPDTVAYFDLIRNSIEKYGMITSFWSFLQHFTYFQWCYKKYGFREYRFKFDYMRFWRCFVPILLSNKGSQTRASVFSCFQLWLGVITVLPLLWLATELLSSSVSAELAWCLDCSHCSFHELPRRKFQQTILTFVGSCWPIPKSKSHHHGNIDLSCKGFQYTTVTGCSARFPTMIKYLVFI